METFMDFLGLTHLTNVLLLALVLGLNSQFNNTEEKLSRIIDLLYEIRPSKKRTYDEDDDIL
jgi:hypothetical protein